MAENLYVRDKRTGNFFVVDNVVIDHYLKKIGVYGFAVYCTLIRHSRMSATWVSQATIAKAAACSVRTVADSIASLMSMGLLGVKSGVDSGKTNTYFILDMPAPGSSDTAPPVVEEAIRQAFVPGLVVLPGGKVITHKSEQVAQGGKHHVQTPYEPGAEGVSTRGSTPSANQRVPILKNKTKEQKNSKNTASPLILPEWLDPVVWEAYLEMRKRKGAKPTDYAAGLIVKKLTRWHESGIDVTESLNQSIVNNWTDVFEPKNDRGMHHGNSNISARTQRNQSSSSEVIERIRTAARADHAHGVVDGGGDGD